MDNNDDYLFEDDSGYLVSVSDIMSGLLFIFIITLMAFVLNFQQETEKAEKLADIVQQELMSIKNREKKALGENEILEKKLFDLQVATNDVKAEKKRLFQITDELVNTKNKRSIMLEDLKNRLKKESIDVEIDIDHGVLRLTEDAIRFNSGEASLEKIYQKKLSILARVLARVLPCFTVTPHRGRVCDKFYYGKLDAVFIEGHTDNIPMNGSKHGFSDNWELSAQRAINTYRLFTRDQPILLKLRNQALEPIFSVTGYGEGRPLVEYKVPTNEPENRRIDLRFIMTPPEAKQNIVNELKNNGLK